MTDVGDESQSVGSAGKAAQELHQALMGILSKSKAPKHIMPRLKKNTSAMQKSIVTLQKANDRRTSVAKEVADLTQDRLPQRVKPHGLPYECIELDQCMVEGNYVISLTIEAGLSGTFSFRDVLAGVKPKTMRIEKEVDATVLELQRQRLKK